MKLQFIGDNQVTLNLQGLRFIQKRENHLGVYLDWEYKGGKGTAAYPNTKERDETYDRIKIALTEGELNVNTTRPGIAI